MVSSAPAAELSLTGILMWLCVPAARRATGAAATFQTPRGLLGSDTGFLLS